MTSSNIPPDIGDLIADFTKSGMRELHVRMDAFEIFLSNDPASSGLSPAQTGQIPVAAKYTSTASPVASPGDTKAAVQPVNYPDDAVIVSAPYLGTFYRAPKPGAPAYVSIGSKVTTESELCLVEVMKLFTAVRATTNGTIHAILVQDGDLVSSDQPLFIITPD
jgi:acetyl-CoA carboxylase biotin carboxyl carrier protein